MGLKIRNPLHDLMTPKSFFLAPMDISVGWVLGSALASEGSASDLVPLPFRGPLSLIYLILLVFLGKMESHIQFPPS